jgi:hypothetical protein
VILGVGVCVDVGVGVCVDVGVGVGQILYVIVNGIVPAKSVNPDVGGQTNPFIVGPLLPALPAVVVLFLI